MEIAEHLVMGDLVAIGGEFYVVEHLVVSNAMVGVEILAYIAEELHIIADMEFVATDVDFVTASVDSLVVDVDEDLLMKHYVQFVPGSEHADWMIEILVFDSDADVDDVQIGFLVPIGVEAFGEDEDGF